MRTRRTKEQIRKDAYNKDVDAYNYYVVNLETMRAETGFEYREDAIEVLNDYDDNKKYKVVSKRALKSMGVENPNESFKYEDGGKFKPMTREEFMKKEIEGQKEKEIKNVFKKFRVVVYEQKKSGGYPFADFETDNFYEAVSFAKKMIQQQKDYRADSDYLWVIMSKFTPIEERANVRYPYYEIARFGEEDVETSKYELGGYFDGTIPKVSTYMTTYAKGGRVKLNTEVILSENRPNGAEWQGVVKPFMLKSIEENQYAGGFKRYEIDIYDEVDKEPTKEEIKKANEFFDKIGGRYEKGGSLIGNQKRIDLNKNGKIDSEDFKLLRTTMNGAWRNDHQHVNSTSRKDGKLQDYEVIYARKNKSDRTGYKGKTNYASGGLLKPHQRYVLEMKGLTGLSEQAIENYISGNKLSDNDVLNIVIGLGRKQLKGSEVARAVVGKKDNVSSKKVIAFAKDNKGMKLYDGGGFQSGVYANGGGVGRFSEYSNDALNDMIINLSRYENTESDIQMVKDELAKRKGKNLVVDEEVTYFLNKDGIKVRSMVEPRIKISEREWSEKHNPRAYEYMGKRNFATGGSLNEHELFLKLKNSLKPNKRGANESKLLGYTMYEKNGEYEITRRIDGNEVDVTHLFKKFFPYKSKSKMATGGGLTHGGFKDNISRKFTDKNYEVIVFPEKLEILINITNEDTIDQDGLDNSGVLWRKEDFGYSIEADNKTEFNKAIKVILGVNKRFASGGAFEMLSNKVAKNYEGKRVKPAYQKEYGKVYSKEEAKEVGDKVAGKVKANQKMATGGEVKLSDLKVESGMGAGKKTWEVSYPKIQGKGVYFQDQYTKEEAKEHWLENVASKYKFASGGETKKGGKGGIMVLAKKIRKEGESWQDALKRAGQQLK
jgi:hypothetical protein